VTANELLAEVYLARAVGAFLHQAVARAQLELLEEWGNSTPGPAPLARSATRLFALDDPRCSNMLRSVVKMRRNKRAARLNGPETLSADGVIRAGTGSVASSTRWPACGRVSTTMRQVRRPGSRFDSLCGKRFPRCWPGAKRGFRAA